MPYSISTLLIRNLDDIFGENDPAKQRAAIDEILTDDCVFYEPTTSNRVSGYKAKGRFHASAPHAVNDPLRRMRLQDRIIVGET